MSEVTKTAGNDPIANLETESKEILHEGEETLESGEAFGRDAETLFKTLLAVDQQLQSKGFSIKTLLAHVAKSALGIDISL